MSRSASKFYRGVVRLLGLIIGLGVIAHFICPVAATRLGHWLAIESQELQHGERPDAIVALGGNTLERTVTGVELYHQLGKPRIALTGYESDKQEPRLDVAFVAREYAIASGVNEQDFELLSTTSTFEDGQQIVRFADEQNLTDILLVSDWTHARRALCTIRSMVSSDQLRLQFAPSVSRYQINDWWTTERGLIDTSTEIAKIGFYALRYGIPMWGCFAGDPNIGFYPLGFIFSFAVSILVVEWMRRNAISLNRMDIPNERSSHVTPTPRGGGIGIVVAVITLWISSSLGLGNWSDVSLIAALVYAVASVANATIGWIDDKHSLHSALRLILYVIICAFFTAVVGPLHRLDLPMIGELSLIFPLAEILSVLWLVGFLNIFNFMDGIDGLAGSQSLIASLFWMLLLLAEGQAGLAMLAGLVAFASLGFLFHNMPPARIFMGDVGSAFLGFTLAAIPVMAFANLENSRLPVVGALFVAPFLFDGSLTILRRVMKRENILHGHRSHLYQRSVIAGMSHAEVIKEYRWLMFLSGICGIVYYFGAHEVMLLATLALTATFVAYYVLASKRIYALRQSLVVRTS